MNTKAITSSTQLDLLQVLGGSLLIALCAQISIPFIPVPLSLQTLAVMLVGLTLGRNKGVLALLLYTAEYTNGLPFLAGGLSNPFALIGPTGGYLMGMIAQAYLAGWVKDSGIQSSGKILLSLCGISLLQLSMGALWLANFVGFQNAFMYGFYPFILVEAVKALCATTYYRKTS